MGSTSHSSRGKDLEPILEALKEQGWRVEDTERGHVKAVPPDRTRPIVHFGHSRFPRSMKNAISELRASGFVWPPQQKEEKEEMLLPKKSLAQQLSAVSNLPADSAQLVLKQPESKKEAPVTPTHVDLLFQNLKSAKVAHMRAVSEMKVAADEVKAAEALLKDAERVLRETEDTLIAEKKAFDEAFALYTAGG